MKKLLSLSSRGGICRTWLILCLLSLGSICLGGCCVSFESPPLGTVYNVGDTFIDSATVIVCMPFQWSNGISTNDGFATVVTEACAGGSGQEMQVNNINLAFGFLSKLNGLTLNFGEYGGNLNITINDEFKNFENFDDINGSNIGGVQVTCTGTGCSGGGTGTLELVGEITLFIIGGQEFCIDDVCPTT